MKPLVRVGFAVSAVWLLTQSASALTLGGTVDNFRLNDQQGVSHELYYLSDQKAVVLFAEGDGCKSANAGLEAVKALQDQYAKNVTVLGIDSNLGDSREAIEKSVTKANAELPIMVDRTQLIGESLGLHKNGEVLVVNPVDWSLAYRGDAKHAADAVAALVNGQDVKTADVAPTGCDIKFPERAKRAEHAKISYAKTIAPMLIDKCVSCHRAGGIAPFAMNNYQIVQGFAPMIREVVRTQRMPPWHADPHYQAFSNSRALTLEQTKTLVHWIEAGAPRGDGPDPLLAQRTDWPEWSLGKPDLIIHIPPFDVPATGVLPYRNISIDNPLDHDVWVRAVDYVPGNRTVLHHVIASAGTGVFSSASLDNYVPGSGPLVIPNEDGILLKKGSKFYFQMHYTTTGKAATDATQFGLYFRKDSPKYNYRAMILANPMLKIPAYTKDQVVVTERTFKKDVVIYTLHPHSHYRGKSAKFEAIYPDGRKEVLLNVPHYDFNWQSTYDLVKPKPLPAGTKIVYTTHFDNSVQNKANPDPSKEIHWGEQTWDEMVFGVIRYRNLVEDGSDNVPLREKFSRRTAKLDKDD